MIVYKLDKSVHASASKQIKDMHQVLNEIAPTLEVLKQLLNEHGRSISTPTVDNYRAHLLQTVDYAIDVSKVISENAQQLCAVSDQASRYLITVDEQIETPRYAVQPTEQPVVSAA